MQAFLKHELEELQHVVKRSQSGVNLTFVKNVLVRYMKEGDLDNSLPAIAQALEFTAEEIAEVRQANQGLLGEVGGYLKLW